MELSKIFIWQQLLCLALTTHMCDAWHFNTSFYILWCSDNHFNQQSSYQTNLKSLLSSLSKNAAKASNNGYYATNTTSIVGTNQSEPIYGLYHCRGDTTSEECRQCVTFAMSYLPPIECPNDKGVIIWYRSCKIRYSNKYFRGIVEEEINYGFGNNDNVSTLSKNVDFFMGKVGDTLHDLGTQLSSSKSLREDSRKYSATKSMTLNSSVKLYAMAECMPSVAPSDCERCVGLVVNELSTCCYGRKGGTGLNPSCYARYEVYPFYKSVAASPSPPPLSPLPDLSDGHSNRQSSEMSRKHRRWKKVMFVFLVGALPTIAFLLLLLFSWIWMRKRKRTMESIDMKIDEIKRIVDSLQFDFNTIKTATSNFAADYKVGEGGFGEVYKGILKTGEEVAVKRLSKNTGHGIEQFKTEVDVVAKLQHKNLVKLLGFCVSSKEKMLVYEFLPNSSLDRFIFGNGTTTLDWETRFKIIVGIARGLVYLHEDSRLKIVHRDLKTSNILLDEAMNPKISDFGLAKLFEADQTRGDTQKIVGTYGYIAPEYAITGSYSVKSDVYSFGVILLEMLSGRKNSYSGDKQQEEALISYAWRLWIEEKALDLVDPALNNLFPRDEVLKCIHIGLLCIQEHANDRPRMNSIVAALNGQTINFPMPKPPLFVGSATNVTEEARKLGRSESISPYTGFDTITISLPRE